MIQGSNVGRVLILAVMAVVVGLIAGLWFLMRGADQRTGATTTSAPAHQTAGSAQEKPIEIGFENAAAPWSQADGTGCANDIVQAAFDAVKVKIAPQLLPYSRAKVLTMEGELVACVAMSWDPKLKGIAFPDEDKPLYICKPTFARKAVGGNTAAGMQQIAAGAVVGTVIDYEYPVPVTDLGKKGVVFEKANSEEANLKKLALGRLDFAVINIDELKTGDYLIDKAGVTGEVAVAFEGGSQPSHIGFSTQHPQGAFARAKFNEGYAIIRDNGTLEKIRAQWRAKQGASP